MMGIGLVRGKRVQVLGRCQRRFPFASVSLCSPPLEAFMLSIPVVDAFLKEAKFALALPLRGASSAIRQLVAFLLTHACVCVWIILQGADVSGSPATTSVSSVISSGVLPQCGRGGGGSGGDGEESDSVGDTVGISSSSNRSNNTPTETPTSFRAEGGVKANFESGGGVRGDIFVFGSPVSSTARSSTTTPTTTTLDKTSAAVGADVFSGAAVVGLTCAPSAATAAAPTSSGQPNVRGAFDGTSLSLLGGRGAGGFVQVCGTGCNDAFEYGQVSTVVHPSLQKSRCVHLIARFTAYTIWLVGDNSVTL